jgi:hypothetical protein
MACPTPLPFPHHSPHTQTASRPAPTAARPEPWFESLPPPAPSIYNALSRPAPKPTSHCRRRVPPHPPAPHPHPLALSSLLARNGASPNHPRGRPPRCAAPTRALPRSGVRTPSPPRARAQAAGSSRSPAPAPARARWRRRVVLGPRHLLRRRRRVGHHGYVCSSFTMFASPVNLCSCD